MPLSSGAARTESAGLVPRLVLDLYNKIDALQAKGTIVKVGRSPVVLVVRGADRLVRDCCTVLMLLRLLLLLMIVMAMLMVVIANALWPLPLQVRASYMEVYNEKVFDLLNNQSKNLRGDAKDIKQQRITLEVAQRALLPACLPSWLP